MIIQLLAMKNVHRRVIFPKFSYILTFWPLSQFAFLSKNTFSVCNISTALFSIWLIFSGIVLIWITEGMTQFLVEKNIFDRVKGIFRPPERCFSCIFVGTNIFFFQNPTKFWKIVQILKYWVIPYHGREQPLMISKW